MRSESGTSRTSKENTAGTSSAPLFKIEVKQPACRTHGMQLNERHHHNLICPVCEHTPPTATHSKPSIRILGSLTIISVQSLAPSSRT